jgi:hypothetical protein
MTKRVAGNLGGDIDAAPEAANGAGRAARDVGGTAA